MARSLLTSDEISKIERPYLLVLCESGLPSLTQSPDLHKWYFNKMLGLGDPDFNTAVRVRREEQRIEHQSESINLWDFKTYINGLLSDKSNEQVVALEESILEELSNAFSDEY